SVRADAVQGEEAGGAGCDEGDDELIEAAELAVQELSAPPQLPQRDADGITGDVTGTRPQRRDPGDQGSRGVRGEPGPQVIGAGQEQRPGLVDRPGAFCCGAALGNHQGADGLDRAVPAFWLSAGPPGLGGPGRADGVQRVGLALPAPVLAVRAVYLHD